MPKLMICPEWRTCEEECDIKERHVFKERCCNTKFGSCPACVPYKKQFKWEKKYKGFYVLIIGEYLLLAYKNETKWNAKFCTLKTMLNKEPIIAKTLKAAKIAILNKFIEESKKLTKQGELAKAELEE